MSNLLTRRVVIGSGIATAAASLMPAYAVTTPALLSPSAMRADVAMLRKAYETLHPGLLRYNTLAESAARFDQLAMSAGRPMTLAAFYLTISRFLATVRCGHTYANFFNQSDALKSELFDAPDRLPLSFVWRGGSMIVTADPFGTGIAPGSEVIAIEGRPAAAILAGLMTVARADGDNDAKRRRLMSVQGDDGYESFDIFYPLMFGGKPRYRLAVSDLTGRRRTAELQAITLAQRRAQRPQTPAVMDGQPLWTMERRGETAVLTMPSWGLYNSKWEWRAWLDTEIDAIVTDGLKNLVVDLRANEGGYDCGNALAARLIERPIPFDTARRLVRYRKIPGELRPYLDTWDRRFDDWGENVQPFDARFLELKGEREGVEQIDPKGPRYSGQVTVLIGPQNSSATFGFAQLVRRERLATLVGEATGGNRRGINGSGFYFLRLPETGLEADLPLVGIFPRQAEPDAGIMPDRMIALTPADIAQGRDPVLAATV